MQSKSTVEEIKERFDKDVERFSNLETGQQATIDAPLCMELIANAALATSPKAENLLDIGCGAGNLSLKVLQHFPQMNSDLLDLSQPMLTKAKDRVSWATTGKVNTIQADLRDAKLEEGKYDIIIAAAVLHHLRDEQDWENAFTKIFKLLAPGGSLWISDLVKHDNPEIQKMMWNWYGSYLEKLNGVEYRENVFDYIEKEDSPRSLLFQVNLMEKVGFTGIEILHKHCCFAAFGGSKPK
ncbi:class I SAM-dependent methyltransferase [Cyclobacterium amurskyense]|jgi:tRNA (cmo5U34)-methyltransferase|uniref:Methyltransferase type 11 n=1 Tax=Cyclobacterium amurskyense TaxID=320787 RepID=A0A0H4PED4_9BACT|nr:class I SAM-dependent methyltransferase [Cyclobacterium amurskyense]AKP51455.1 Methyltransferase type 11 [Cyclobacterium amurskyense]|tara:strand:+ start:21200 stop:21916 length:717 start_codon:yes stop_codon:yes gene_type:complete